MRLVYIHSNSEKDVRMLKEIESLLDEHVFSDVKILYWDRDGSSDNKIAFNNGRAELVKFKKKATFGVGAKKNMLSRLSFFTFVVRWLLKNKHSIDAIHIVNFELAFLIYLIKPLIGKKVLVYDVYDYIVDGYGNSLPFVIKKMIGLFNKAIVRSFSFTLVASENRVKQIDELENKKVIVIENAPNYNGSQVVPTTNMPDNGRITLVYVGVLSKNRYLVELAEIVNNSKDYELYIGGFGILEGKIRMIADHSPYVHFLGRLEYADVLALEKNADAMVALYSLALPNNVYAAPNKFYESMFLGKPVVMVKGSGMSEYVDEFGYGVTVEDSITGLESGLNELKMNLSKYKLAASHLKEQYDNKFSWNIMKRRLVKAYESALLLQKSSK